jgi:8-amino-7-oxononanoate synthase
MVNDTLNPSVAPAAPALPPSTNGHAVGNGHPAGNVHALTNGHAAAKPQAGAKSHAHAKGSPPAKVPAHARPAGPAGIALFDKCRAYDVPQKIKAAGVWTYFRAIESAQDPEVYIDGQKLVMLGSNNYLGLTNHPKVKEAAIDAVRRYGTGCAGSRFLNGTMRIHEELEEKLADFMGKEAAVTFSTGFQVNLGTIACLLDRRDIVYLDKQDHACIIDGARLGLGEIRKFRHNSAADLRRMMAVDDAAWEAKAPAADARPALGRLVVVDGVYSMEGDICPLPEMVDVARAYGAAVMVDDAHGIGVLGKGGRGTAQHFDVEDDVHLIMGTFSKALASVGGFVCGDRDTMHYVKHRARTNVFSAAPSPSNVAAASMAVDIIRTEPERRTLLWQNTRFMLDGLRSLGFDTGESGTPVIPVVVGEDHTAFCMATRLQQEGRVRERRRQPGHAPGARAAADELHGDAHRGPPELRAGQVRKGRARVRGDRVI